MRRSVDSNHGLTSTYKDIDINSVRDWKDFIKEQANVYQQDEKKRYQQNLQKSQRYALILSQLHKNIYAKSSISLIMMIRVYK